MLGNRTLVRDRFDVCSKTVVVGNTTVASQLWQRFCVAGNTSSSQCDDYFLHNNLTEVPGIPGLGSGVIRGRAPTDNMATSWNHRLNNGWCQNMSIYVCTVDILLLWILNSSKHCCWGTLSTGLHR